ncbi:hypothetical protein AB8Z76_23400 [Xanthomonas phaseoli pv. phaseoli]|uniref:Peptide deformylase n=1 Tax=Xanthomonas campestris pv. phaseoli TaxID=317013 RepID=A0AB38DYY1_XANCH|nr:MULTISPECIES: hypothetical protein [Xanthomonas]MDM4802535.1 hypothetical protein [Xanthomonas phaseoli pv. phaseoli]MDM4810688.1 hypothetical protein [Xanthomonas phaseoli pv. phaseoli]QTG35372.1 hypothetical protein XppCFBP412P_23235 [Xanthomonas phaseoli pv. phaseoli]QUF60103.1 hypothetical protein XppCFBP6164P_24430 [Xanthomonas phaseoli pv. phaseoli]UZB18679.1 hypothetical protein OM949_09075 [Xanthomonas phaseoli pv. phaseoli]
MNRLVILPLQPSINPRSARFEHAETIQSPADDEARPNDVKKLLGVMVAEVAQAGESLRDERTVSC